jgi:hypothetical protein
MRSRSRRDPKFLIVRRRGGDPFYDLVLEWVGEHYPDHLRLFDVRDLPYFDPTLKGVVLHVPWLQDPVQAWSRKTYLAASCLALLCDLRGIPIINRVDRLTNTAKSTGARLMSSAGLRTPRIARIENAEEFRETLLGVPLPLFVRDDWGHQGPMLRADTRAEAAALPIEQFPRPVAIELIDLPDRQDGLYRKYRYVAAGKNGVTHHLQVSPGWITRGKDRVMNDLTRQQELDYVAKQDPNHAALQRARELLGLEFLAFDYSYDYDGRVVVWEANPYPYLHFSPPGGSLAFRDHAMHRTVAAMFKMYLEYGGVPVPESLAARVAY